MKVLRWVLRWVLHLHAPLSPTEAVCVREWRCCSTALLVVLHGPFCLLRRNHPLRGLDSFSPGPPSSSGSCRGYQYSQMRTYFTDDTWVFCLLGIADTRGGAASVYWMLVSGATGCVLAVYWLLLLLLRLCLRLRGHGERAGRQSCALGLLRHVTEVQAPNALRFDAPEDVQCVHA